MLQFMITFNHVEGVWERLSPEDREAHGQKRGGGWLVRMRFARSSHRLPEVPAVPQCKELYRIGLSRNQGRTGSYHPHC